MLEVTVEDDGGGIPDEILASLLVKQDLESHTEGIGLRNSNQRLEQIYGPEYGMEITSSHQHGTSIAFCIPKNVQKVVRAAAC